MRVLFVGGNGNIAWYCAQFALDKGFAVTLLTRGLTFGTRREPQARLEIIQCDAHDLEAMERSLGERKFDVVCDFVCFNERHAMAASSFFEGRTKQYIFISSVVVYDRISSSLPFQESAPKWRSEGYDYAKDKIDAEQHFIDAFERRNFPVTIVRPAHTYDTIIPSPLGHNCYTAAKRYLSDSQILIAGDGTNLWSLCHSSDFARAFVGLFGHSEAVGEDFHIAGEEWLTWLDITRIIAKTLLIDDPFVIPVPSSQILKLKVGVSNNMSISYLGTTFKGQRMWCDIYDNSKIKKFVKGWKCETKFEIGFRETIDWLNGDSRRQRINPELDALLAKIAREYEYLGYRLNDL